MKANRLDNTRDHYVNLRLNEYENHMLIKKSKITKMTKSAYLRELICGVCPAEAPPPEFYRAVDDINKIGVNINQIAAQANYTGVVKEGDIRFLREMAKEIYNRTAEIKMIVNTPNPYPAEFFERDAGELVEIDPGFDMSRLFE